MCIRDSLSCCWHSTPQPLQKVTVSFSMVFQWVLVALHVGTGLWFSDRYWNKELCKQLQHGYRGKVVYGGKLSTDGENESNVLVLLGCCNKCHQSSGSNNRHLVLSVLEAGKSKIRKEARPAGDCHLTVLTQVHTNSGVSSYKDTNLWRSGSRLYCPI